MVSINTKLDVKKSLSFVVVLAKIVQYTATFVANLSFLFFHNKVPLSLF